MKKWILKSIAAGMMCVPGITLAQVTVDFDANTTSGCTPLEVVIVNKTQEKEKYTFTWSLDEGQISSNVDTARVIYLNHGVKSITLKAFDATGNLVGEKSKTRYITAFSNPRVSITKDKSIVCKGARITFTPVVDYAEVPIKSWWWEFGDGTLDTNKIPTHMFSDVRDSAVQLLVFDKNGCSNGENRARERIDVQAVAPSASFYFDGFSYATCEAKSSVKVVNNSSFDGGSIKSYLWTFPDGTTSTTRDPATEIVYRRSGVTADRKTFKLVVTGDNGCVNDVTQVFTLYDFNPGIHVSDSIKPAVSLEHLDSMACPGTTVTVGTTGDNIINQKWYWNGDTTTTYSDKNTFKYAVPDTVLQQQTYTVTLKASNVACTKTVTASFKVEPTISYTINPYEHFICESPKLITFNLVNSNVPAKKILWYIDSLVIHGNDTAVVPLELVDSTVATGVSRQHRVISDHSYDMKVDITTNNQCFSSTLFPQNVLVYIPKPRLQETPTEGCAPLNVNFTDKSWYYTPGNNDYIERVEWLPGDQTATINAQPLQSVMHTYTAEGVYVPVMVIYTHQGCSRSAKSMVEVGTKPTAVFSLKDTIVCALPGATYLDFSTIGTKVDAASVVFSRYDAGSNKTMTTAILGHFKADASGDIIVPHNEFPVSFKTWVPETKIPAYMQPGLYDIAVTAYYNGCPSDVVVKKNAINVSGPWSYIKDVTQDCADPYKVTVNVDTLRNATSWYWLLFKYSFNTRSYSKVDSLIPGDKPQKNYAFTIDSMKYGTGHYIARLVTRNDSVAEIPGGCADSAQIHFAVTDTKVDFAVQDKHSCLDSTRWISFDPLNDKMLLSNLSWTATLPDGTIDNVDSLHNHQYAGHNMYNPYLSNYNYPPMYPASTFPYDTIRLSREGKYIITATATDINNCVNTKTDTIEAYTPHADFEKDTVQECRPFTLKLFDKSAFRSPLVKWRWITPDALSFSNRMYEDTVVKTNNSADTVIFSQKKKYTVILEVTDQQGCVGVKKKVNYVVPLIPSALLTIPDKKVCVGNEVTFERNKDDADSLYEVNVDSINVAFDADTSFTLRKTDPNFDKFTLLFGDEFINKPITVTSYVTSSSGAVCTDVVVNTDLDVRDARAANPELVDDSLNCYTATLKMNATEMLSYTNVEWNEVSKTASGRDSLTYKGNMSNPHIMISNPGVHILRLKTFSQYTGCKLDSVDYTYDIDRAEFTISADKSEVCVGQTINFTLSDTVNFGKHTCKWLFGDGDVDSVNLIQSRHSFERLFELGTARVVFKVDNACNNAKSLDITVRQVLADFDRGENDLKEKGCPPFTLTFYNKSVGASDYLWDFGDGTYSSEANPTHTFRNKATTDTVKLVIKGYLCDDMEEKVIKTMDAPSYAISELPIICQDKSLSITLSPTPGTSIQSWDASPSIVKLDSLNTVAIVQPDSTTSYTIHSIHRNNGEWDCYDDSTILVKVQRRPFYTGAPKDYLVYLPHDTLVTKPTNELYIYDRYNLNNDSLPGISYRWEPSEGLSCTSCASPGVQITRDMNYQVTMSDSLGCFTVTEEVSLKVILETVIGLPTAFTPNADGSNDVAIPRGWGVKEFIELRIYNRWGELVFETHDIEKGWDGTLGGRSQDTETFAWTMKYKDCRDEVKSKQGYISLLR